jgi:hypothetical protein
MFKQSKHGEKAKKPAMVWKKGKGRIYLQSLDEKPGNTRL